MTAPAPQNSRTPVIQVDNLVTHYGEREILHGVSLTVEPGEIMVIMGGSGSGKSTLLRHLLGLERASSGSIQLLGKMLDELDDLGQYEIYKKIGVAFQGGALFSSLSLGDNIKLPLREHTNLDADTMEIMLRLKLEIVSLAGFEDLMPSELSGGMIKRAAFARAIIMDPEEPLTLYNIACAYSLQNEVDKAIDCLERSLAHGFVGKDRIRNDPDLNSLRDDPRFQALLQKLA